MFIAYNLIAKLKIKNESSKEKAEIIWPNGVFFAITCHSAHFRAK